MAKQPKVSIIIPNLNGETILPKAIDSIVKQSYKGKIEIIIVDNASTDNSVKTIKKKFPEVKTILLKENIGFAPAFNIGLKQATGEIVVMGNSDVVYDRIAFSILVKTFNLDPKIGLVGPKIYGPKPSKEIGIAGLETNPYLGFHLYDKRSFNRQHEVSWLSGCTLFIKKEVINKIGPLDEKLFLYFDDTDFCFRARRAGFKLMYNPQASVWHGLSVTANKELRPGIKNYYWYQSKFHCILKNCNFLQVITSLLAQALVFPYKVFVKRDGTGIAQIKGIIWSLKNR